MLGQLKELCQLINPNDSLQRIMEKQAKLLHGKEFYTFKHILKVKWH